MQPAQDRLASDLAAVAFSEPSLPVVNNVDAAVVRDAGACRDALVRQVSAPVRWLDAMRALAGLGISAVVELGPGNTLVNLMKQIEPDLLRAAIGDPEALDAAAELTGVLS
jgi:[acyl-carrier-protein] S-malonyltransferase